MNIRFIPKHLSGKIFNLFYRAFLFFRLKKIFTKFVGILFFEKGITFFEKNTEVQLSVLLNDNMTNYLLENGIYEGKSIKLAMNIMKDGGIFIDVGANFGMYTCLVSSIKKVQTYAIEPSHEALGLLIKNIRKNQLHQATAINGAIFTERIVKFQDPQHGNIGTGKTFSNESSKSSDYLTTAMSLSELVSHLSLTNIQLIKIDVEGSEMNVIKSFNFKKHIAPKNFIIEYEPRLNNKLAELFFFFQNLGYEAHSVEGKIIAKPPEHPLPENNIHFSRK